MYRNSNNLTIAQVSYKTFPFSQASTTFTLQIKKRRGELDNTSPLEKLGGGGGMRPRREKMPDLGGGGGGETGRGCQPRRHSSSSSPIQAQLEHGQQSGWGEETT